MQITNDNKRFVKFTMKAKNKKAGIVFLTVITFLSSLSCAKSAMVDITINDNTPSSYYGNDPRIGVRESGEVSANSIADSSWDLRAMMFDVDTNHLLLVSGFNPLTTNDGYSIGDIFIDTNGSSSYTSRPNNEDGYFNYQNPGFEGCINITGCVDGLLTYSLTTLATNSIVQSSFVSKNSASDPWKLVESGSDTVISTGTSSVELMSDNKIKRILGIDIGKNGGDNYVYWFDLSPIMTSITPTTFSTVTFSQTESCGNDLIVGSYTNPGMTVVPELKSSVSSLVILIAGLLGVRNRY